MQVKLEYITPDAEYQIGKYAAICYDSKTDRETCIKRAKQVSEKGHLACLRFAAAVFNISGISRVCSHQMVRSKFLDFLQRSQRYCKENDFHAVNPFSENSEEWSTTEYHFEQCQILYDGLLNSGVKKEDARFVLPEATHTELNVVGNLQAWMDFVKLRADKHAQWEIRNVAIAVNNLLAKECPNLFKPMEVF